MCRTYGASENLGTVYPSLPRWANLFRAYGADVFAIATDHEMNRKIQAQNKRTLARAWQVTPIVLWRYVDAG
jgi:hypothetical protein